jgi:hypothetical protein
MVVEETAAVVSTNTPNSIRIALPPSALDALRGGHVLTVEYGDLKIELHPVKEPVSRCDVHWMYNRSVVLEWPPHLYAENIKIVRQYLKAGTWFSPLEYRPGEKPIQLTDPDVIVRMNTYAFCGWAARGNEDKPTFNNPLREPVERHTPQTWKKLANERANRMAIQQDFGTWTLDPNSRVLDHNGQPAYQIDLDQITSAAEVLDWIFQLEEKDWVKDAEIADFVRAILYLFGRGFCGSGRDDPIDIKVALRDRFGLP